MVKFSKNSFRLIFLVIFIFLMIANLIELDFNNLAWNNNSGSYLGIIANLLMGISMKLSLDKSSKKE